MGGKSSAVTVGYKFSAGAVLVIGKYVSKVLRIRIGDKMAWQGRRSGAEIYIEQPLLFGTKSEGGVVGTFVFQRGEPAQNPDPYLIGKLGSGISADRGVSQLVLRQPYLGNSPYLKDIVVTCERVYEKDGGEQQWYEEKAGIVQDINNPYFGFGFNINALTDSALSGASAVSGNKGFVIDGFSPDDVLTVYPSNGQIPTFSADFVASSPWGIPAIIPGNASSGSFFRFSVLKNETGGGVSYQNAVRQDGYEAARSAFWSEHPNGITLTGASSYRFYYEDGPNLLDNSGGASIVVAAAYSFVDINAAHLLRECLLNKEWGYGYDDEDLDDDSFTAVADTLHADNFGVSYFWDDDSTLDAVINKVLDHIDGVLFLDRSTLQWKLALIRADYDPNSLIELRDTVEIGRIDNYKKPQFLELVNTVTINYYNLRNSGNSSMSQSNAALFLQQGKRIPSSTDYMMINRPDLAARLLQRELDVKTNPYASCDIYSNSAAKDLRRGSVFKLTASRFNFNQTIMRVVAINYGDGATKAIKISCTEDRFAMPATAQVEIPDSPADNSQLPTPLTNRLVMEEPYALIIARSSQEQIDAILDADETAGFFGASAERNDGALTGNILVDSGSGYENVANLDFCPFGTLQAAMGYMDTTATLLNMDDADEVDSATLFQIDNEILQGVLNPSTGALTSIKRGIFDTVSKPHVLGSKVFFIEHWLDGTTTQYVDGESINIKILPITSKGILNSDLAPVDVVVFGSRAIRPYAPGLFKIGGSSYPVSATGAFAVTWAHRDRVAQSDQIVDASHASLTLPVNQRYSLAFYNDATNALLVQRTDIGAATASVTLNFTGNVRCELYTINDDGVSLQKHSFVFAYTPPGGSPTNAITATAYTPVDDSTIIDGGP